MLLLLVLFACRAPAAPPDPFWNDHAVVVVGEAQGPMCTVVALHGYGANPDDLKNLFAGLEHPLQVVLPRGPTNIHPKGWAWFPRRSQAPMDAIAREMAERADALVNALPTLPAPHPIRGKPIITGFSQGAMLSFTAATRHPDAFQAALPLSGFLPTELWPDGPAGAVPIHAFHGELDNVIPLSEDRAGVDHLAAAGWNVDLSTYPQTTHSVPPPMRADYWKALAEACP